MTENEFEEFAQAYIEAMLGATNDESTPDGGRPMNESYSAEDLAPEARAAIKADCRRFLSEGGEKLIAAEPSPPVSREGRSRWAMAGHDFFLTRVGSGVSFDDGDWPENGDALATLSEAMGCVWPCVGDDGKIWT